jgi:membrane protease YdiL (CAAX protease family)
MKLPANKRFLIYIIITFGFSWILALVILLTGGLDHSPEVAAVPGLTLAYILMVAYMWGPALGNLLTRLFTHEGFKDLKLNLDLKQNWCYWLIAWIAPAVFIIIGAALFFIIFPQYFDSGFWGIRMQIAFSGQDASTVDIPLLLLEQSVFAIAIAPILNALATFGEEFGWRGYLLPLLQELGTKKALIFSSLAWGVWHWPIIAMGYNYGSDYFGSPWLGLIMMVWTTLGFGVFMGWLTLRAKSIWPGVIAHGAINGFAAISTLVVKGNPSPLLGPIPIGLIAGLPFIAFSLWVLLSPNALQGLDPQIVIQPSR